MVSIYAGYSIYAKYWDTNSLPACPAAIALVKALFSIQKYQYFSYFSMKTYVVDTH